MLFARRRQQYIQDLLKKKAAREALEVPAAPDAVAPVSEPETQESIEKSEKKSGKRKSKEG
jgi:hypothetical protein